MRFRSFNPQEIDRLTATEAFEQVAQSFGVIAIWHDASDQDATMPEPKSGVRHRDSAGARYPFLLLARNKARLPLDLDELATRWEAVADIDAKMREFRDAVAEAQRSHVEVQPFSWSIP